MTTVLLRSPGDETPHEVAVERAAGDGWRVTCGDETILVAAGDDDTLGAALRIGERVVPVRTLRRGETTEVWVAGRRFVFERETRTARRAAGADAAAAGGDVKAPMPGTILDIRVAAGETVAAHAPLIIMESMKMEMTLSAPAAGRVSEVLCTEGALVDMGAVLVRLEFEEPAT